MQNNKPEACISESSREAKSLRGRNIDNSAQLERNLSLRKRTESELRALSHFICGHDYIASRLVLGDETLSRATAVGSSFQSGFLRGELLRTAISLFRSDIDVLLRPYEELVSGTIEAESSWERLVALPSLESNGDHLNLLHRLVLVMIFREEYVIRACALMLGCRDAVVRILRDEGISRLDCA